METLEEILCNNKNIREGALYNSAKKASSSPETGIQIITPSAKNVIQDCATITVRYLPFWIISHLPNIFSHYQNQVSIEHIKDFIERCKTDPVALQLKILLLDNAKKIVNIPDNYQDNISKGDPYNDFIIDYQTQSYHNDIFILSKAFQCI